MIGVILDYLLYFLKRVPLIFPCALLIYLYRIYTLTKAVRAKRLTDEDFEVDPKLIDPTVPRFKGPQRKSFEKLFEVVKKSHMLGTFTKPEKTFFEEFDEEMRKKKNETSKYKMSENGDLFLKKWKAYHEKIKKK